MNLNEFTINTLESNYLKGYLRKINHNFKLEEMITIVFNSSLDIYEKFEFIENVKDNIENPEYQVYDRDKLLEGILLIEKDYDFLEKIFIGDGRHILVYLDKWDLSRCFTSLTYTKNYLLKNKEDIGEEVLIIIQDGETSDEICYLTLNKNLVVKSFSFSSFANREISFLYDKYIDIPNDIKVGDIIKITGDDKEWVTVYESTIPEHLMEHSEYSIDLCITAVPKEVLDDSRSYKEQIDEILEKRKNRKSGELDIISKEHEHLHLSIVEKI